MNAERGLDRITADPQVCVGRPCIRDTRMRVSGVLDLLVARARIEEVHADPLASNAPTSRPRQATRRR
jgi:uncharacterized protein (DUF433 family)